MKKLALSLIAFTGILTMQAQQLLIVNKDKAIDIKDIDHISYAQNPQSTNRLIFEQLAVDPKTTIFSQALKMTGLSDSLMIYDDESYPADLGDETFPISTAELSEIRATYQNSRPHRFTAFVETDSIFRLKGINNLDDLKAWAKKVYDEVYPEDASVSDPTDRRNSLNRFVSYHFLRHGSGYKNLTPVNDFNTRWEPYMPGTVRDVTAYYETMMPYASLKCSFPRGASPQGIYLNRSGLKDNYTVRGIHIIYDGITENGSDNGLYYYIDDLLAYDKTTQTEVLNELWRVDFKSLSPDIMNIGNNYLEGTYIAIPNGFVDNFQTDAKALVIGAHNPWWSTYEGDLVYCADTKYIIVKLPPLPAGQWQVRFGYIASYERPIINTYINNTLQFSNIDLREYKTPEDVAADENLFPGPDDYYQGGQKENVLSDKTSNLCRVVGAFTADGKQDYYLRIENADSQPCVFQLDYLEFAPVK